MNDQPLGHLDAAEHDPAPVNRISCPFCGSSDIEPMSLFGQQLLTVQFYCNGCRTPFEKIKDEEALRSFRSD